MRYRREIDGLRALAVLPVILFHAGFTLFGGGYVGVDVFFVISGYLITWIILDEKASGTFTLTAFYERRARRILPTLFLVASVSVVFAWRWMSPPQMADFARSLIAVFLFSSNILFFLESGYFDVVGELKPLLHTWSLGVEEQYYLLFPLLVLWLWKFGRRHVLTVLIGLWLTSFALGEWWARFHPDAAFYLLPTRLWELLTGSIVAIYLQRQSGRDEGGGWWNAYATALGILMIVAAVFWFDRKTPFPGVATLLPVLGATLVIVFAGENHFLGRWLGSRFLVGIGLVSYSAYLWHQPVFAFARIRSIETPSAGLMGSFVLLSFCLAFFSWRWVERPFRQKARFSLRQVTGAAVVISLTGILWGFAGLGSNGFDQRTMADGSRFADFRMTERLAINQGLDASCEGTTTSPQCRTGDRPEVMVWGDSLAMHWMSGLQAAQPKRQFVQMTKSFCGPFLDIAPTNAEPAIDQWAGSCIDFNQQVLAWLKQNPGVRTAVLGSMFQQYMGEAEGVGGPQMLKTPDGVQPATVENLERYFAATLAQLQSLGVRVVIVAPPPTDGRHLGNCLAKTRMYGESAALCRVALADYRQKQRSVIDFLQRVEKHTPVLWPSELLCDASGCAAEVDGVFIYRDDRHLSREGSTYLGTRMGFRQLLQGQ